MLPRVLPVLLPGPVGVLEALIEDPTPAGCTVAAFGLVLHPHPKGGGTMTNKVVHTLARAIVKQGVPRNAHQFPRRGPKRRHVQPRYW